MQPGHSEFKSQTSIKQNFFPHKAQALSFLAAVRCVTPPNPHQRQQMR